MISISHFSILCFSFIQFPCFNISILPLFSTCVHANSFFSVGTSDWFQSCFLDLCQEYPNVFESDYFCRKALSFPNKGCFLGSTSILALSFPWPKALCTWNTEPNALQQDIVRSFWVARPVELACGHHRSVCPEVQECVFN